MNYFRYTLWPTGEELYDLVDDPHEETNLAAAPEHAEKRELMRASLKEAEAKAISRTR